MFQQFGNDIEFYKEVQVPNRLIRKFSVIVPKLQT